MSVIKKLKSHHLAIIGKEGVREGKKIPKTLFAGRKGPARNKGERLQSRFVQNPTRKKKRGEILYTETSPKTRNEPSFRHFPNTREKKRMGWRKSKKKRGGRKGCAKIFA